MDVAPRKELARSEWELLLFFWRLGETTVGACHRYRLETRPSLNYTVTVMQLRRIEKKGWLTVRQVDGLNYYKPAVAFDEAIRWLIDRYLLSLTPKANPAFLRRATAAANAYLNELGAGSESEDSQT